MLSFLCLPRYNPCRRDSKTLTRGSPVLPQSLREERYSVAPTLQLFICRSCLLVLRNYGGRRRLRWGRVFRVVAGLLRQCRRGLDVTPFVVVSVDARWGDFPQSVDVLGAHQVHRRHASRGIAGLWSWMRSSQRSLARRSLRTLLQARHHGARPSLLIWPSLLQPTPLGRRPGTVARNGHAEDIHLKQDRCRRRRLSPSKPKSPTGWWFPFRRTRIVAVFHVRPSSLCHKVPKFLPAFCPRYKYVANGS